LYSKYADILYTMGGYDNLRLARKYYAQSLDLCQTTNIRSFYGLIMCTIAIEGTKQGKQDIERNQDPENNALFNWAFKALKEKYTNTAPQMLPLLQFCSKNKGKDED